MAYVVVHDGSRSDATLCDRLVEEDERVQQAVDVDLAVRHAAHERVALEVLDLVEVE